MPRGIAVTEHKGGARVRRPTRNRPKAAERSPTRATLVAPRPARPEYSDSDLVELARRMSIPDDEAMRQFVDRAMRLPATDDTSAHRSQPDR